MKKLLSLLIACLLMCSLAMAEQPADDEVVLRTYTLENSMPTPIRELYVYQSRGANLVPDGLKHGEQIQVPVAGYYLRTPNQTLYTVEYVAGGETYAIRTLHVEDLFNVLYLTGTDASSGATAVSFLNPDGTAQEVEKVEAPAEGEIAERVYTLENATGQDITELYVYRSRGENLTPNGLQPGEQVQAEVMGYYLHTPNETLYTVEYTTEGDKFLNTYSIRTLHIEDLFEVLYLTGADAASGATPVAFTAPAK
ncbi:MAG: hypothetical protein IJ083_17450 [Clostridia bacterium]|nr:hypothetical protein [Clostridia bacterium]